MPCGKNCSDLDCQNLECSIGCADSKFGERVYDPNNYWTQKIYTKEEGPQDNATSKNINFDACHPTWQTKSIDLNPVDLSNSAIYNVIAIPAMIINIGLVYRKLVEIIKKDVRTNQDLWNPNDSICKKAKSIFKIGLLLSSTFFCLVDSVFDALYFIKLKTVPRIIHVPAWIHVVQGVLLYSGELPLFFENLTILKPF